MANVQGSLISRIVDGIINMDVMFQYEATYGYQVVDQEVFQKYMSLMGELPVDLLNEAVTSNIILAFAQVYPEGMVPAEIERPNQTKLLAIMKDSIDENWNQSFGIGLSSFCLCSFKGDPAVMAQIEQMQEKQRAMGIVSEESRKKVCPYCDSTVLPDEEGHCPCCDALLKEE